MSLTSDLWKLREKRLKENKENEDIAPVKETFETSPYSAMGRLANTSNTKAKEEDEAPVKEKKKFDFFDAGSFSDGYQFGDVTKAILGTVGDVGHGVLKGGVGLVEGLTDVVTYGAAGVSDLVGADELAEKLKFAAKADFTGDTFKGGEEFLDKHSLLGKTSQSVTQGLGQVAAIMLTGGAGAAAGLGTGATTALTTGVMGLSGMGSGMGEAYQNNATDGEAVAYGLMSGAADAVSELFFGGLGKAVNAVGFSKGLSSLDDMVAKKVASKITNQFGKNLAEFAVKSGAEGVEEVAAGFAQAAAKQLTYMSEEEFGKILEDENLLEQFVVGALTSGMIQSGIVPGTSDGSLIESTKQGKDFITGYNQNEQAVIKQEVENRIAEAEKDGKKLTAKEKSQIEAQVEKDMEKGYISTDTIESVLGDNREYQSLLKESEEFNTLYKTEGGKLTEEQKDRLAELKEKNKANSYESLLQTAKNKLSASVYSAVQNDRLAESYNERARRREKFTADLTQYNDNQKQVVQKAIDSGFLNNTNRTHEFVDIIAKISADKGVPFDFTNNEKLKESGFAIDGKQVNGFITKDGITLNMDSPKAWQSTVGHEITHVLEGTELYTELQNTLFEYAKSKGEYQTRYDTLTELYKNVKDADIDAELTSDLVGDYLFQDTDFINNLSTKNRNVFEKIYDEIKYLCKVVTAGSKEARELEKVRKAFADAYRASGKGDTKTKYSISEVSDIYNLTFDEISKLSDEELDKAYELLGFSDLELELDDSDLLDIDSSIEDISEETGVEPEIIKILYRRKGLGDSHVEDNHKAVMTLERIDQRIAEHGATAADYARRYITRISPKDFIDMTVYERNMSREHFDTRVRGDFDGKMGDWDYKKQLRDSEEPPYLSIDMSTGQIIGHNGRHRMRALEMAGIESVDIEVEFHDEDGRLIKYDAETIPDMAISSQFDTAIETHISNIIPFNNAHRSEIVENYGEKAHANAAVKYSISDSDGKQLSKGQQDYFKDSKMRDDNGNLKVMYHGTENGGFHTFDSNMSDDGTSFFFTDSNDVAKTYSGTKSTYSAMAFRTADELNSFLTEADVKDYEVREEDGKFRLYEDGDVVAESDTAQGLYEEFKDWPEMDRSYANYKVYLNLKNPLEVDAEGRNWDNVSREFWPELYEQWKEDFTEEEKAALEDLAGWEDYSTFKAEVERAIRDAGKPGADEYTKAIYSAYWKNSNISSLFSMASDYFSDEVLKAEAVKQLTTRDYAQKAKEEGYDGVIFKNIVDIGGYGRRNTPSTVAIAFDSNQIKSVANQNPTSDPDIRYSVSEEQNQQGLNSEQEVTYSISKDTEYADSAIALNEKLQSVPTEVMQAQKLMRERVATRLREMVESGVALPADKEGDTFFPNKSYGGTEENTLICPRSLAPEAFMDAVSEYIGRPLTVEEQIYVGQDLINRMGSSEELRSQNFLAQCVYCYVAADRMAQREFLGDYLKQRDSFLQTIKDNPNMDVSQLSKDHRALAAWFKDKTQPAPELSEIGNLYKEFLGGRKPTGATLKRVKSWVDAYKNGKPMIDGNHLANIERLVGDLSGFDKELIPQIKDAWKYAQSASWAKKRQSYVAYNGHIQKWDQKRVDDLNKHYGLRLYSFSDFHPAFVLENMQMITDASVRKLKMLAYTKDMDFVEIFAPSGININVSTFGFERNGNIYEDNRMGAEWEKAKALREQNPNVGITFVATNDTMVKWALKQDWIDVVIPYHMVKTGQTIAEHFNYQNYTQESSDKKGAIWRNDKSWSAGHDSFIAPPVHNNDLNTYLAALAQNGLEPRFKRFLDDPETRPYYMKLVNECRLSASESNPVQPIFNEDAINRTLARLASEGYYTPIGGSVERMYEIAGEVAENMPQQTASAMSLSNVGETQNGRLPASKDLLLEQDIAPVAEATKQPASEHKAIPTATVEEMFPDEPDAEQADYEKLVATKDDLEYRLSELAGADLSKPELAEEYDTLFAEWTEVATKQLEQEQQMSERFESLDDADAPPEMDAPVYGGAESASNPFTDRNWYEVGRNRKTKAFMRENPEFKPFFQEEALNMLYDLGDSQKGERWYNDELHYESGGEKGFGGQKRFTSQDIEQMLDSWGMSYDQIYNGLTAIAEDSDKVNNAAAKRIEFMLNQRLMNGYKDFHTGKMVEPNQAYLDMVREWQHNQHASEEFDSFMATADQYAPAEEIAPVKPVAKPLQPATSDTQNAPVYPSTEPGAVRGQTTMFAPEKPKSDKVAQVLTKASKKPKEGGIFGKVVSAVVDKGRVFEKVSLDHKNMEVQSKWQYALPTQTEARAQYFMEHGENGVKSLKSVMKEVNKAKKTDSFQNYLYHVHNIDRMTLDERFGVPNKAVYGETITADVSRRKVAQLERQNPEFKRWAQDVYNINKQVRNKLVEGGLISQEVADLWEKMYPHYVPITRVDQNGKNVNVPLDTNKTGVNAPVKRAIGGNSDIEPLFNTMAQRIEQTYRAIARNSFGVELKNTLGTEIESKPAAGVDEMIDTIEMQEELLKQGGFGVSPTFTVFENGERVEFEITEDMYDALKPANKILSYRNPAIKWLGDNRRNLLTVWNPVFALYRNPIKDIQDVAINSQHPLRTYANVPNAIVQMLFDGRLANEYHQNGGKSNTYFDGRKNQFKAEDNVFKKIIGMPVRAIETAGEFIEEIPRLAEYIASRKDGRSVERSMLDAARVTTNFAAGGDFTKFLNAHGFTFLNASVQGAAQHVRNFREATKLDGFKGFTKTLAKYVIAGVPAMLLNGLLWDDDEEYEELNDYVKQNYYVVAKTGDGKFIRIPKGRTTAVMSEVLEQMQNLVTGDDEADFSTFFELFLNNIAPNNPLKNNIISPIVQAATNNAWYEGDIVPSRLQDLPAEEQFDESTDSISKWLGEKTGWSPMKINYLLDQYSGGLGDTFLPIFTPEAESGDDSTLGNFLAPWKKEITTDKVLNNKNPGDFYDLKDELEITSNGKNATEEDKMKSMYMDTVSWEMGDLYAQKREIQSSNLPDSQKYEKVRQLQEQINELAKNASSNYHNVSINGLYSEVGDKRFNLDEESGTWYEIKPKKADGTDNWFYQKEQEVTKALGISYGEYWNNREEYNFQYDNPEKYTFSKAIGGYESYRSYSSDLYDIKADKDENGKSISGSRKEKVIDYINEMDADYGEKIILFKSEYPADDTYNQDIFDYVNGRDDLSYDEKVSIFKYLEFDVDSEGYVTW